MRGVLEIWQACTRCEFAIRSGLREPGKRSAERKAILAHEAEFGPQGHKVKPLVVEAAEEGRR